MKKTISYFVFLLSRRAFLLLVMLGIPMGGFAAPADLSVARVLTLPQAEGLAIKKDPLIAKMAAKGRSFKERSIAAKSWPDPKLKLGVMNLSTETLNTNSEPMTQMVFGVKQMIPRWGARDAMSNKMESMGVAMDVDSINRRLMTLRGVRMSWLDVYFLFHAKTLVHESLSVFDQLHEVTRLQYKAGRGKQQDVVRAQLESSLLADKETEFEAKWDVALAKLKIWLSLPRLHRELDMGFPELPQASADFKIKSELEDHPFIRAGIERIKAAKNGVDYANAQKNNGYSLDVQYGHRTDPKRNDFVSAMLMVDFPLFTSRRHDRQIAASEAEVSAAQSEVENRLRQLQQRLDIKLVSFKRKQERILLYESQLLPQAKQNTEATLNSYQSGVTPFNNLVRAKLTELKSQLQYLKLTVDRAKIKIDLLYLSGKE